MKNNKVTIWVFIFSLFVFHFSLTNAQIITTVAGGGISTLGDSGQATAANLDGPYGIAVDKSGNIYISDMYHSRIRKVDASSGIITTYAGNGMGMSSGDGGQATAASLVLPAGIALDTAENLYITDENANVVRKVNYTTGIITTVAGNGYNNFGEGWYYGDGGPATVAELDYPQAVAIDKAGNIYIADYLNNRIRKVDTTTGIITTVAGNGYGTWVAPGSWTGAYSGDGGPAVAAELYGPDGVIIDDSNNIIISDDYNSVIRKVSRSTGIISTIAGNGFRGFSGDGGFATVAEFSFPGGVDMDASGNIYIADAGNNEIRIVSKATGIITNIAGNGYRAGTGGGGFSGDGSQATEAEIWNPQFVMLDDSGNYYITDVGNERVRKVSHDTDTVTGINKLQAKSEEVRVFPNPNNGIFNLYLTNFSNKCNIVIFNYLGENIYTTKINSANTEINIQNQSDGVYFYRVISENGELIGEGKFVVEK